MKDRITVYPEGKIDIHKRSEKYESALARLELDCSIIPQNKALITAFLRDCTLGKAAAGKGKKKIGVGRCLKYLGILKQLSTWFGLPFDQIKQEDMEAFIQNLESDKIRATSGKPFSERPRGT